MTEGEDMVPSTQDLMRERQDEAELWVWLLGAVPLKI